MEKKPELKEDTDNKKTNEPEKESTKSANAPTSNKEGTKNKSTSETKKENTKSTGTSTAKKVIAKSVPIQKKTVIKEAETQKKTINKMDGTQKDTVIKKAETQRKTVNKNDEAQKKTVIKKDEKQKKKVNKKVATQNKPVTKKAKIQDEKIKEQEELIEQVEEVSEQAQIYEDLLEHDLLEENEELSEELIDPKVFKDNELETIKKELKDNKNLNKSKAKRQEKYKEIFKNSLIFIFIELYFLILLISKSTISTIEYITDLKLFILIELVVSIILFEIAYKKDNSKLAWHGIEIILLGATTILILELYSRQSSIINTVFAIIAGTFIIYYIIKMFIIALKKQK